LTVDVQIPDSAGVMAAFSLPRESVVLCNVMVTKMSERRTRTPRYFSRWS
jgi:hypothetical protein